MPTAASIAATLASAGRIVDRKQAEALAADLACYGAVDLTAAALSNDDAFDRLRVALGYKVALAEVANPSGRIARLRTEAADLDYRAAKSMEEGASFAGRAAYRLAQGEHDLAADFQRRADVCERQGATLTDQASELRAEADQLAAADQRRGSVTHLIMQATPKGEYAALPELRARPRQPHGARTARAHNTVTAGLPSGNTPGASTHHLFAAE